MTINPIIPIWIMTVICVVLLIFKREEIFPYIRQIIAIILLFAINLRIMVPDDNITYKKQELNTHVVFVVDNTISMLAQDYDGNKERAEGVRNDCTEIIRKLNGAKFSVIAFDNSARRLTPFTRDIQFAENAITTLYPPTRIYARGTSLNAWKDETLKCIKEVKTQGSGNVVVFFISDGEITFQPDYDMFSSPDEQKYDKLESFEELKKYIDDGAVLGYGTSKGGIMQVRDFETGEIETMESKENWGENAISKINEKNLKKIADDMGIGYVNMNSKDGLEPVIDRILQDAEVSETDKAVQGYKDIYFIFLIPFMTLVSYEYVVFRRKQY